MPRCSRMPSMSKDMSNNSNNQREAQNCSIFGSKLMGVFIRFTQFMICMLPQKMVKLLILNVWFLLEGQKIKVDI